MAAERLNELWLARHGETEWTVSRQHTSVTDLGLTGRGEQQARALGGALEQGSFALVLTSPLSRARRTAELAGFPQAETDDDLFEYRYGDYEGVTTAEIHETRPDWNLWRDGCPGGETTAEVAARADRLIARVRSAEGAVLAFSSGHISRVIGARFLGLPGEDGALLGLGTAALSVLGYEHGGPVIERWNDRSFLAALNEN
jgi:broad specificity phosphatase PhoE